MKTPVPLSRAVCSRRPATAVMAAAALLLTATACGSSASPQASPGADGGTDTGVQALAVNEAAVELLPESISSSKILRVAIPTNEPPTQFYREGTQDMTGANPDVARLIGQALGLEVEIHVANFDSIIPGIAAGRYDMTVSSMTPTEKRMEVLDFVDYIAMGSSVAVAKGNPQDITDQNALCGQNVGLLTGSYQLTAHVPKYDEACAAAGKEPLQTNEFQDTRQAISALTSGRMDAVLADSPILDFAASQDSGIEIASQFDFTPVGVGISKESGLVDAVSAALAGAIESDSYLEVLGKYGLESSAITDARVNFAQ